jgi:serine/threonine protein kinase
MDKKKNYNLIPERIDQISKMLEGKHVESILDAKSSSETDQTKSEDIRDLMPKKYIDFSKAVSELGGKLLYIKSGSTGHTFKGVYPPLENGTTDPRKPYAVKIVAYPKKENYGDMYNIKRPENAELMMIKLLSQFVRRSETPHIVLPIATFNTSIKPFLSLAKSNLVDSKKFDQFLERYEKGEYYQNVSVLISEWANGGDLLDYLRKHYKTFKIRHWRTIFYQFLSVMAIVQAKYPSFRHNDLKANNLLINLIDMSKKKYKYVINGQTYIVPNIGFQIKLWDFDFACIPGLVNNSKVESEWTKKINITPHQNRYYDVHYFFNTLTRKGFFPEFWTEPEIPEKVKEFVNRVVPEKYKSGKLTSEKGRILINDEYLTADEILKNDQFFKVMRENIKEKDSDE